MSFNSSWVYSLPGAYNPVVGGQRILSAYFNGTMTDLATALSSLGALVEPGQTLGTGIGYLDVPKKVPSAGAYTLILTDRGKAIYKDDAANITVPPNSSVAFPTGSSVSLYNFNAGSLSLLQGSGVSLYIPGSGSAAARTLAAYSFVTLWKFDTNSWLVVGAGVT